MPVTKRAVKHALSYSNEALYANAAPDAMLGAVDFSSMCGVLHQLGFMATYATEMFQGLFEIAQGTQQRLHELHGRMDGVLAALPGVEHQLVSAAADHHWPGVGKIERSTMAGGAELFTVRTRPQAVDARYGECDAPPSLTPEQLRNYSNPAFFVEEWLREEQARQEVLRAERAERKERRRERRRKMKAERQAARQETQAAGTKVKGLNWRDRFGQGELHDQPQAQGRGAAGPAIGVKREAVPGSSAPAAPATPTGTPAAPAAPPAPAAPATPAAPPAPAAPAARPPPPSGAPAPPPVPGGGGAPAPPPVPAGQPAPPPVPAGQPAPPPPVPAGQPAPPPVPAGQPAPPPVPAGQPAPPPPPMAPAAPAPPPMPMAPAAPAPPPMPMAPAAPMPPPMPAGGGGPAAPPPPPMPAAAPRPVMGGAGGLLGEIQAGKKLRAAPVIEKKPDAKDDLLSAIRSKKQLKHVEVEEKPAAAAPAEDGGIMSILSRRMAIAVDSSDDDSDDDSDEWDD